MTCYTAIIIEALVAFDLKVSKLPERRLELCVNLLTVTEFIEHIE